MVTNKSERNFLSICLFNLLRSNYGSVPVTNFVPDIKISHYLVGNVENRLKRKLLRQQTDETVNWQISKLTKWQTNKMATCQKGKLTK